MATLANPVPDQEMSASGSTSTSTIFVWINLDVRQYPYQKLFASVLLANRFSKSC